MTTTENNKLLIGTYNDLHNRRLFYGSQASPKSFILYNLLRKYVEYAAAQVAASVDGWLEIHDTLNKKLEELRDKCPEVCKLRTKTTIV